MFHVKRRRPRKGRLCHRMKASGAQRNGEAMEAMAAGGARRPLLGPRNPHPAHKTEKPAKAGFSEDDPEVVIRRSCVQPP